MNELAKDVKSSKEKGWFTLENQEKLFEAGIVVFKLLLTKAPLLQMGGDYSLIYYV